MVADIHCSISAARACSLAGITLVGGLHGILQGVGGLYQSAVRLAVLVQARLLLYRLGDMVQALVSLTVLDQLGSFTDALLKSTVSQTDALHGAVKAVQDIARCRAVCCEADSRQAPRRHYCRSDNHCELRAQNRCQ